MPFGGLIVNRVTPAEGAGARGGRGGAGEELGAALARKVARTYRDARALAERDAAAIERAAARRSATRDPMLVPQLDGDVHDVDGLARGYTFFRSARLTVRRGARRPGAR